MLNGKYRGGELGSGTDVWKMSEDVRAGNMSQEEFFEAESCMHRSHGHCMTMGTASTMASMVEALRSVEHTSELQSLMRNLYAVFCLKHKRSQLPTHK